MFDKTTGNWINRYEGKSMGKEAQVYHSYRMMGSQELRKAEKKLMQKKSRKMFFEEFGKPSEYRKFTEYWYNVS